MCVHDWLSDISQYFKLYTNRFKLLFKCRIWFNSNWRCPSMCFQEESYGPWITSYNDDHLLQLSYFDKGRFFHLLITVYAAHILSIRHLYYINCHNIFTNLVIYLFLWFWRDYHSFCLHINTFSPQVARSGWQIFWNWIELTATLWLLGFKLRSSKRATSIPNQ